jgi:hypothetical protein
MKFSLFALVATASATSINQSLANNLEGFSPEVKSILAATGITKSVRNAQGNFK